MYPLHTIWMVEQMIDPPRDPERLDRIPVWARPRPQARATRAGLHARIVTFRGRLADLIQRGSLGPLPNRCAGDPAGPRW
jgi:hypothetical protein